MVRGLLTGLCALALWAWAAPGQAEVGRLSLETWATDDSDDATQLREVLRYRHSGRQDGALHGFSIGLGRWWFDDPVGNADFDLLDLGYEYHRGQTDAEFRLRQLDGDGWEPTLGNVLITHRFDDRWYGELFAERVLVDSVPAIRQELTLDSGGFSLDYRVAPDWTLVGALFAQSISDGNDRQGGVFRIVYEVPAVAGLTVQTKSLRLDSDFDGVGYFSPEKREEHLLLVGYARALWDGDFVLRAKAGPGRQRLENEFGDVTRNDLLYAELAFRGWFDDHRGLESRFICTNSGGPNTGVPTDGYRYCSADLSLILSW